MTIPLVLLLINAVIGAVDTLWYHEWRAALPQRLDVARPELRLHVMRDVIYCGLYGSLAWWRPAGWMLAVVAVALLAEVVITMADFVIEDRDRPAIGGIAPGERILHSMMAIIYGSMLAFLLPELAAGWDQGGLMVRHDAPLWASLAATFAAVGIAISGTRDAAALAGRDPISRFIPAPEATS